MSVELVLAISSGLVALGSAFVSSRSSRRQALLSAQLEEQAARRSREAAREDVTSRYRDPLLWAAFDLQSRVFNIVREPGFLSIYYVDGTPRERHYALRNTLFVYAEYLGWVEILRRRIQFLDLGDHTDNRRLVDLLDAIARSLNTDAWQQRGFRLFRGEQRAIGESVLARDGETCIGYGEFCRRLDDDPAFAEWYAGLTEDLEELAARPSRHDRLIQLQSGLIDLIDFLDPEHERFPTHVRQRLG